MNRRVLPLLLLAASAMLPASAVSAQQGSLGLRWPGHPPVGTSCAGPRRRFGISVGDMDLQGSHLGAGVLPRRVAKACDARHELSTDAPSTDVQSRQFALVAGPAITCAVRSTGWYAVPFTQLHAAGLPSSADPRTLRLYGYGQEVAIAIEGHGPNRRLEFYGTPSESSTSSTHTYWLTWGGTPGKRIPRLAPPATTISSPHPTSFPSTVSHPEHDNYYPLALGNGGADFFGPVLNGKPITQTLTVTKPARSGEAMLSVAIQGASASVHHIDVSVNGHPAGSIEFSGVTLVHRSFTIPRATLMSGANMITLAPSPTSSDLSLMAGLSLTYARRLQAVHDTLAFTSPAGGAVRVTGFSSRSIRMFDVSDPESPFQVSATAAAGAGGTSATIRVPASGPTIHHLIALGGAAATWPAAVATSIRSTWHAAGHRADLLIIGYKPFLPALQPLIRLRERQGLRVAVVDVQSIYDEFGFGDHGPDAIKAFLRRTVAHWTEAPRYVLLAGSASFDPKDYLHRGMTDYVPTALVDTAYMQTASDSALADFNGDGVPDMAIGRLPVRTAAEAATVVAKIVDYSPARESPAAAFVVGQNHPDDALPFAGAVSSIAQALPTSLRPDVLNQSDTGSAAPAQVLDTIDRGPAIVNFFGHGNVDFWGGNLFDNAAVRKLTNGNRLPLFIMMTCLNGYFIDPGIRSLGETLLTAANGGAVAAWASTGQTAPDGEIGMNRAFYQSLAAKPTERIGDAILAAAARSGDPDVRKTWAFFGDPTMQILPIKH